MKILIIHPNFPGQYKHIAQALADDKKNEVLFLCKYPNPEKGEFVGVHKIIYKSDKKTDPKTHRYLHEFSDAIYQGQVVWRVCQKLKSQGFTPDVIVAHPGWGDGLFLRDIYPDAAILFFMEYFYHAFGADINFGPNAKINHDVVAKTRVRNAPHMLYLDICDYAITPTYWQYSRMPKEFREKISVLHDGVDTDLIKPQHIDEIVLPDGRILKAEDEIITYATRNFEPYRGFPTVIRAVKILLEKRPNAKIVMIGDEGTSYGSKPQNEKSWKEFMLKEVDLQSDRVIWLNKLPFAEYLKFLFISKAHIYLTVPFVLSWSLIEAMAAGCKIVASKTLPVEEVLEDGKNALLADFFDEKEVAEKVSYLLDNPQEAELLAKQARKTVEQNFALNKTLPLHLKLIKNLNNEKKCEGVRNKIAEFYPEPDGFLERIAKQR